MTEYTDEQIIKAADIATRKTTSSYRSVGLTYLHEFLDALPEPAQQDDWQECTFEDIRKGDRVKEVVNQGHGTIEAIEGVAHFKAPGTGGHLAWKPRGTVYQLALDDYASDSHKVTLYRIPAKVVHPDPAEHPVIIDSGEAWTWNSRKEMYHRPGTANYKIPEGFADWEPADIVPKVRVKDAKDFFKDGDTNDR